MESDNNHKNSAKTYIIWIDLKIFELFLCLVFKPPIY